MFSLASRSAMLKLILGTVLLTACAAPAATEPATSQPDASALGRPAATSIPGSTIPTLPRATELPPEAASTLPRPMPTAAPSRTPNPLHGLASRHDPFAVRCHGGIELLRTDDLRVISSMPLDITECTVAWSPDNTAIAVLTPGSALFIASADDGQFHRAETLVSPITMTPLTAWSPNSEHLLITQEIPMDRNTGKGPWTRWVILDREASEVLQKTVDIIRGRPESLWLQDQLIAIVAQDGMNVYRADNGHLLGQCPSRPDSVEGLGAKPFPFLSPDGKWLVVRRQPDETSAGAAFEVVDALSEVHYPLSSSQSTRIDLLEWKKDSTAFFFIRDPEGLVAFDTATREIRILFDLALDARFNADQEWAFVLFPSGLPSGGLSLSGGIWRVGTSLMLGRHTISKTLDSVPLYSGPDMESIGRSGVIPVAWSKDGMRVAWVDDRGRLVTQSIRGADKVLSEELSSDFDFWVKHGKLSWVENDLTILIEYDTNYARHWIPAH